MKPDPKLILRTLHLADCVAEIALASHSGMLFIDYCILVSQRRRTEPEQFALDFVLGSNVLVDNRKISRHTTGAIPNRANRGAALRIGSPPQTGE